MIPTDLSKVLKRKADISATGDATNFPAGTKNTFRKISGAGVLGGGLTVAVGDIILCHTASAAGTYAAVGANWTHIPNGSNVAVSDVAYNATTWDNNTDAPTKNAIRDQIETMLSADHDEVTLAASAAVLLGVTGQELSLDTQTANTVLAGPTSGAAAAPTFRAIVSGDLPTGFVYKGLLTLSDGMNLPAATLGDWYIADGTSYWIGGTAATGIYVNAGDVLLCTATAAAGTYAGVGGSWWIKPRVISLPDGYRTVELASDTAETKVPTNGYRFLNNTFMVYENSQRKQGAMLLSKTTVTFAADGATTLFTVPAGFRCVLHSAVVIAAADAGTTTMTIGQVGALTDFLGTQTLSNLDAAYDAVILQPVPNATPVKVKSYAATTVIQADVGSHAGGAGNIVLLYGSLY